MKKAWNEGRTAFGLWAQLPGPFGVEAAASGFDYVCVDQQHGLADYASLAPMFQSVEAVGAAAITRVLRNDSSLIGRALDAGARGVIVPLVNDAREAKMAVSACRFPPDGTRSYGPIRASGVIGSGDTKDLDRGVVCIVMVETLEGLKNVEEIAATPGLDGIYTGPADLALSLGLSPATEVSEKPHVEAVEKIKAACKSAGIASGIHADSGELAKRHAIAGFDMVTVTSDASLLKAGANEELNAARA